MIKNYTNYDSIDFAEEPSFIRWVQGKDPKARAFWEEWANDHPEKKGIIKEAKALVQSIQIAEEDPSDSRIEQLWQKIDAATEENTGASTTIRTLSQRNWISYAVAASVGLLLFFYFYKPTTSINSLNGQHLVQTLPDNSRVELNAASTLSFNAGRFSTERTVHLEGEAFFEVEEGSTFRVITSRGTVEVLGTSFNVSTRNNGLEVDCRDGRVRVTAGRNPQILTEGEGTRLNAEKTALTDKFQTNIVQKTGWRSGDYYFTNVLFSNVIEELQRQYDVQIECTESLQNRLGDYTFKGGNLEQALSDVSFQLNVQKPVINGKKIVILE